MEQNILPVESIRERDIDLLLLEELNTDDDFCSWFVDQLNYPPLTRVVGAWRSINGFGLGETDILFFYYSGDKRIYILIENKLDSSFQFEQYDRYRLRAETHQATDVCDEAYCMLMAPELYCHNQQYFDNYLTYESVKGWFNTNGTRRSLFKGDLLTIAIDKLRRGYHAVNSEIVQKFWLSYWLYKEANYPGLAMKWPGTVPHGSDWPILTDRTLTGVTFTHKFAQGNIEATIKNLDDELRESLTRNLPPQIEMPVDRRIFTLRLSTGGVDRLGDFDGQLKNVENGLIGIVLLRDTILKALGSKT